MTTSIIYSKSTPRDVIAHAMRQSPHTFIAYLRGSAAQQAEISTTLSPIASKIARDMASQMLTAAKILSLDPVNGPTKIVSNGISMWVPTYNGACTILDLPRHVRSEIVERTPDGM